eukprot:754582-Hanusia_phi.AAC.18
MTTMFRCKLLLFRISRAIEVDGSGGVGMTTSSPSCLVVVVVMNERNCQPRHQMFKLSLAPSPLRFKPFPVWFDDSVGLARVSDSVLALAPSPDDGLDAGRRRPLFLLLALLRLQQQGARDLAERGVEVLDSVGNGVDLLGPAAEVLDISPHLLLGPHKLLAQEMKVEALLHPAELCLPPSPPPQGDDIHCALMQLHPSRLAPQHSQSRVLRRGESDEVAESCCCYRREQDAEEHGSGSDASAEVSGSYPAIPSARGDSGEDEPAGVEVIHVVELVVLVAVDRPDLGGLAIAPRVPRVGEETCGRLGVAEEQGKVVDGVPAVEHALENKRRIKLDAREGADGVLAWDVADHPISDDSPQQVDPDDVPGAQDRLRLVQHKVPHRDAPELEADEGRQVQADGDHLDPEEGMVQHSGGADDVVEVRAVVEVLDEPLPEDLSPVDAVDEPLQQVRRSSTSTRPLPGRGESTTC